MTLPRILGRTALLFFIASGITYSIPYYGLRLGTFETISNDVKGEVFAADDRTLFIKGFSYDGTSEDAVIWAGFTDTPDSSGFIIPNDLSSFMPIPAYHNQDVLLRLPDEKSVKAIRWLSVWNRNLSKSLGTLVLSKPIQPPHPMAIGPLVNTKRSVSSGEILILDTQTILVTDFNYGGPAKETYMWLSKGTKPNEAGIRLQENGSDAPLQESTNSTVVITLPKGHFITDYDTLSVWNVIDREDYGFVDVPKNLNIPPSSRTLGKQELQMDEFNCEMLNDNLGLEVRWLIKGDDIILHLIGNIGTSEYMALGLSKDDTETRFDSADAVVGGIHADGKGYAVDYFFESNEKCENGHGMCPDSVHGSPDNLELLHAERAENYTVVTFKRRLRADDKVYDQNIYTDGPQAILWAVGTILDDEFPDTPSLQSRGNLLLDFGREPNWNCPPPKKVTSPLSHSKEEIHNIRCPGDRSFRAQIGSSSRYICDLLVLGLAPYVIGSAIYRTFRSSQYHYTSFTRRKTSNITTALDTWLLRIDPLLDIFIVNVAGNNARKVWYINGLPTAELTVQRGHTYTFIIEGGLSSPLHHPFYITNSKEGGLLQNIMEGNAIPEYTFAGIGQDPVTGTIFPTAEGRLCDWTYSDVDPEYSILTQNHDVKPTLALKCEPGQPGKLLWTPTAETADVVYYQSFMERSLGGKIHVVDFCEETNPRQYLQITTKGGKPKQAIPQKEGLELESEREDNDFSRFPNKNTGDSLSTGEFKENVKHDKEIIRESVPAEFIHSNYPPKNDKYTISDNVINAFRIIPDIDRNTGDDNSKQTFDNENATIPPFLQVSESVLTETLFPHDESERSDIYIPHHLHLPKSASTNKLSSHRITDDLTGKRTVHSSEVSSVPALMSQPPQNFKPHFEGGFIPLVVNPMKEKEFAQAKEFVHVPQQRRPHRPFLYNESVPFHGTFKPGVPDFSGFNISNYSQEDASIILAHQDSLSLLSASRPQPVHKPGPPIGAIPLHLLKRNNGPVHRPRRPQEYGYRFRQQNPAFGGPRRNVMPHLSTNNPNIPIPNIRDEDLTGVPSQRVYVSLQASGDKKSNLGNIPNMQLQPPFNRKNQNHEPNKAIYPPPIQRRPDFYEDREVNFNRQNSPQRKFNPQSLPLNANKHNQQKINSPSLQSGRLQGQVNIQSQIPGPKVPSRNNFPGKTDQIIMQSGTMRHPNPMVQVPLRERIPHHPVQQKGISIRPITHSEKMLMREAFLNLQEKKREKLPFPLHAMSPNEKFPGKLQEMIDSQESDSTSSKEQRPLPLLPNGELIEVPSINMPQKERLMINHSIVRPQIPQNGSMNIFADKENIRILSSASNNQPHSNKNNMPFKNVPNFSVFPYDIKNIENVFENQDESILHAIAGIPQSEIFGPHVQKTDGSKNNAEKQKIEYDIKIPESVNLEKINPVQFGLHEEDTIKTESVPIVLDYEKESDDPSKSDYVFLSLDYSDLGVPFGARLKFPQNGSKVPLRPIIKTPKSPLDVLRKSPTHASNIQNVNAHSDTRLAQSTITATDAAIESVSSSALNKESISTDRQEALKNLYYTPPFSSLPEMSNASSNLDFHSLSPDDVKHIPIIADSLEGIAETKYLGRKNILPLNSNSSFPPLHYPPKLSENINLPQISEKPPTNDNGTDYSILNHIMTLIGGPPESNKPTSS